MICKQAPVVPTHLTLWCKQYFKHDLSHFSNILQLSSQQFILQSWQANIGYQLQMFDSLMKRGMYNLYY